MANMSHTKIKIKNNNILLAHRWGRFTEYVRTYNYVYPGQLTYYKKLKFGAIVLHHNYKINLNTMESFLPIKKKKKQEWKRKSWTIITLYAQNIYIMKCHVIIREYSNDQNNFPHIQQSCDRFY